MLKLVNLNYGYTDGANRRSILKDCSYTFEDGRFYTILGPSGSGKTTLLSILAGLDSAESGEVWYNGEQITANRLYPLPPQSDRHRFSAIQSDQLPDRH